ncbi:hypothetical protein R83H12_00971 [Fibrobacteria bacterium R8-3-H12]
MKNGLVKWLAGVCLAVACFGGSAWGQEEPTDPTTCTVTFDAQGGTPTPESKELACKSDEDENSGDALGNLPNCPSKTGYSAACWYTATTGGTKATVMTKVTENTTFYAQYSLTQYDISYTLNSGDVSTANPTTYNIESSITLNNPTRTGYTFAGWTGSNGSNPQTTVTISAGNTGNKSYIANWTAISYNITYELDGGTAANPTSYNTETPTITLNNPTRTGYTFAGWTGSNGSTPQTAVTISLGSTGDKSYTATWGKTAYSISYDLGGGTAATNPTTYNIETPTITLNNPTRTGYTFTGWTGSNGSTPQTTVTIDVGNTGNKSYIANWTASPYTVSFNTDGGSGTTPASISTYYDAVLTAAQMPSTANITKSGYVNDGKWYIRGGGGSTVGATIFAENFEAGNNGWVFVNGTETNQWMIGTAIYYAGSYSAYISNVPPANSYDNTAASVVYLYKDITFPTSTANFTLTFNFKGAGETEADLMMVGYRETNSTPVAGIFSGNTLGTANNLTSSWIQKSVSLPYATFSGKAMRLAFIWMNDPSGGVNPPAAIDNISISATLPNYTYTEFIFGTSGTVVENDYELFLKWVPQYTVRFDANGGTLAAGTEFGKTDASGKVTQPTPTRTGYTFNGWYTAATGGTSVPASNPFTANTTVYAQWTISQYTVTFNANGNTESPASVSPVSATTLTTETNAGQLSITLPTPTRAGYAFDGWYTAATGGTQILQTKAYTANTTIYAHWSPNLYTISFNTDGGGTAPAPIQAYRDATLPALAADDPHNPSNFTKTGHVNDGGWHTGPATARGITIAMRDSYSGNDGWSNAKLRVSVNGTDLATNPTIASGSNTGTYTFSVNAGDVVEFFWVKGNYDNECAFAVYYTNDPPSPAYNPASGATNDNTRILLSRQYSSLGSTSTGTSLGSFTVPSSPIFVFGEEGTLVKDNTTLYLKWVSSYTVTFNPNGTGGTVTPTSATTRADGKLDSLPTPERAGYDFTGWYTTPAGTVTVSADRVYTAATTIYAHWTPAQYTIAYTLAGGTVATANPATYNIESASFTLNNPTRTGYTFAGWTGSNGETPQTAVSIATGSTGNKEYTANWTPVQYTITYDLAGGTLATDNPATYNIESDAIALNNPTREGYTFAGWTGGNGTTPQTTVSIATGSTGNKTYTANWTQNPIVSFNLNGGTGTIPSSISTAYGTTLTAEQKPSTAGIGKSGYANDGIWYTRATVGTPTSTTIFSETFEDGAEGWVFVNGTQTNKWTIGTATAYAGTHSAYISDDESTYSYSRNATSIVHLYKDIEFPESNTNFTLTYYFRGVGETSSDYMIISYGQTNSTPVAGETFGTELATAVNFSGWTSRTVTLPAANFSGRTIRLVFTWRNDNFLGNIPPAAIDNIAITGTPGNYTYTPFIFGGENATVITRDTTLYLKWFPAYTVSFNSNGGSGISPYYVFSNIGLLDSLPTPIREGYAFEGWFTAAKNGTQITKNTPLTSDTTIYAHWTKEITPIMPQIAIGNQILQTKNGINLAAKTNAIIEVYNLSGKLVSKQSYVAGNHSISLSHLPKGMYIVRARFAGVAHSTAAETLRLTIQ